MIWRNEKHSCKFCPFYHGKVSLGNLASTRALARASKRNGGRETMPPIDCQKAVVVSDVYLGYSRADSDAFLKFIDSYPKWNDSDRFILIGDIFDFWRRQNAKLLVENQQIIERILSRPCKVTFLRGNHDYCLEYLVDRFYNSTSSESRNFEVAKTLSIRSGQKDFFPLSFHGVSLRPKSQIFRYRRLSLRPRRSRL